MKLLISKIIKPVIFEQGMLYQDYFILMLRVVSGLYFMKHGIGLFDQESIKGFADWFGDTYSAPFPMLMSYLRHGIEFLGGLMLIIGLFTRISAFLIFLTMLVAILTVHAQDFTSKGELAVIYVFVMLTLVSTGAGRFSVDSIIFSKKTVY